MNQLLMMIPCFIIILALMATVAWLLDKVNCMEDGRADERARRAAKSAVKLISMIYKTKREKFRWKNYYKALKVMGRESKWPHKKQKRK